MFEEELQQHIETGRIPAHTGAILLAFYKDFIRAIGDDATAFFLPLLDRIEAQIRSPYQFEPFHKAITAPFNYQKMGIDLMGRLIGPGSSVQGDVDLIESLLKKGDNVILLSNHQTETDPQIMLRLLETHPYLIDQLIFIAGEKVVTDPVAVPFSLGCNLICIYSRRHIDHDPATKAEKLEHNHKTMRRLAELLDEGSKCIWVAPSGGRDRLGPSGKPALAPFDPPVIEMLRLIALRSHRKTHFFPLALFTFDILPPPPSVEKGIGEQRSAKKSPAHLHFGHELDLTALGEGIADKHERRAHVANLVWKEVQRLYEQLEQL